MARFDGKRAAHKELDDKEDADMRRRQASISETTAYGVVPRYGGSLLELLF